MGSENLYKSYSSYQEMVADKPAENTIGVVRVPCLFMEYKNGKWCNSSAIQDSQNCVINDTDTAVSFAPLDGFYYEFKLPLTELNIEKLPSVSEHCIVRFKTASTGCDIYFPSGTSFFGSKPVFNTNKTYMLSIGHGVVGVGVIFED